MRIIKSNMDRKRMHHLRTVRKGSTKDHTITKAGTTRVRLHHTKRVRSKRKLNIGFMSNLEVYAFWTGVASTLVSLIQVIVLTNK